MSRMNSSQEFWIIILQLGFWGRGIWILGYGRVLGTMLHVHLEFVLVLPSIKGVAEREQMTFQTAYKILM